MQKSLFILSLAWIALLSALVSGCATPPAQIGDPVYYRSKEYVIYKFQPGDTAASIAQAFLGDASKSWIVEDANKKIAPGDWITIPLKSNNRGGVYGNGLQQVPILCYHQFGNDCASPLCTPKELFERQMKYLRNNGYHVISPQQLMDFLAYRQPLPKKSVMITIDDGYRSVYTVAYPILKKYGFPATLFIYTNYVGVSTKAITWEQIRELKQNGFTIGSHTVAHSDLSKQGDNETQEDYLTRLRREISISKQIIDKRLSQDTFFFAYPFGRVNQTAMTMARNAGYRLAVTVKRGGNAFDTNPYLLRRDQILSRDMRAFRSRLKTFQSISLR